MWELGLVSIIVIGALLMVTFRLVRHVRMGNRRANSCCAGGCEQCGCAVTKGLPEMDAERLHQSTERDMIRNDRGQVAARIGGSDE